MTQARFLVELRAEVTGDVLTGHAATFHSLAQLPNHYEAIAPTAFDEVLKSQPDVRALINHDPSLLLARTTNGSLELGVDETGLTFSMTLPNTTYANDLRELVAKGLVTGMSFGFVPGKDEFSKAQDGKQIRTHTSISRLLDVSPVTYPAFEGTDLQLRSLDSFTFEPVQGTPKLTRALALFALEG